MTRQSRRIEQSAKRKADRLIKKVFASAAKISNGPKPALADIWPWMGDIPAEVLCIHCGQRFDPASYRWETPMEVIMREAEDFGKVAIQKMPELGLMGCPTDGCDGDPIDWRDTSKPVPAY